MQFDSIILIPPCFTYGDTLGIIGLIYFLLEYYDKVYLYINAEKNNVLIVYYEMYFENSELFNKRIFILTPPLDFFTKDNPPIHICNTFTDEWESANFLLSEFIDKNNYFNTLNPIYNRINIDDKYKCVPNLHLPRDTLEINHLVYYKLIGLNNIVRMNYFNYSRDLNKEDLIKNKILLENNIENNEKYNIINTGGNKETNLYIKNSYKTIDIHMLVKFPGMLLSLIEGAETIHLIYSSNVHLIYHCQYKNIMKNNKIYYHVWAHNRTFKKFYMLEEAWKCMTTPLLDNWQFLFTENDAILAK